MRLATARYCAQHVSACRSRPMMAAAIAIMAVAVALTSGCRATKSESRADTVASTTRAPMPTDEGLSLLASVDRTSYRAISDRNLFRPLVVAPKGGQGTAAGGATGGSASGGPASKGGQRSSQPSRPSTPSDPTADLALTGIIETTDGLRALVEQISTRRGEFVAVGEQVFGFTVKSIEAGMVTLARGPNIYTLRLGAKEIPQASPPASTSSSTPSSPSGGTSQPSVSPPTFSPPPGMPDFRNMSSEQRRQFFRDWWNRMPEEQRERFRSRGFGMGGFGGPRGGFSRGDRGR